MGIMAVTLRWGMLGAEVLLRVVILSVGSRPTLFFTAMQSPQRQPLSDLEGAILGIVALSGPLTSYAVARVLAQSPSSRWSGSAGAVYPATGRLEERAFLAGSATEGRRRPRRTLTLTPAGETALAEWLAPPLPVAAVRATEDPIRTRVFFLGVLPPRARAEFIASAREMLARELATLG